MAFLFAKRYLFLVVLIMISLLSFSLHARELQHFSQMVSITNDKENNSPQFVQENSAYGLYGQQEKTQHLPSDTTESHTTNLKVARSPPPPSPTKQTPLPWNYNEVAYLSDPDHKTDPNFKKTGPTEKDPGTVPPPPKPTTPLPWNYNKVAYLTGPDPKTDPNYYDANTKFDQTEEEEEDTTFGRSTKLASNDELDKSSTNNAFFNKYDEAYKNDDKYRTKATNYPYNSRAQEDIDDLDGDNKEFYKSETLDKYGNSKLNDNTNYFDNSESTDSFDEQQTSQESLGGKRYSHQPQGMSDTRFVRNGKYFYDLENEQFPHQDNPYNKINSYRNNKNTNNYNYRNQFSSRYQEEDIINP